MLFSRLQDLSDRPFWFRYGLMLSLVLVAFGMNLVTAPLLLGRESLLPFMVAVLMSGMLVGMRPGFFAMLLSIGAGFLLIDAESDLLMSDYMVRVTYFILLCCAMLCLIWHHRGYQQREADTLFELERREEQLRTIIEKLPIGVWLTDEHGVTLAVNEAGRSIWGGARYVGMSEYPRYYPMKWPDSGEYLREEEYPAVVAIQKGIAVLDQIVEIDTFNGETRMMKISAAPLRLRGGDIFGTVVICENVTGQLRMMEELQRAKEQAESASVAKDRFLSILSHELRTPLTPVLLLAEQLESHPDIPESLRADAGLILRHITLEARLIDDLLDLTRIERGRLQLDRHQVDLHQILTRAVNLVRPEADRKGIPITLNLLSPLHYIYADRARIKQAVLNVLGNALKFTPTGGNVSVATDAVGKAVRIRITDTGIGIDTPTSVDLFGEFEQASSARRFGGLGLGLPIARALMDLHEGQISIESQGPGKGTQVTMLLPASEAPREPVPSATDAGLAETSTDIARRILLVEDHEPTAFVLARLLRRQGHHVETAANVKDATRDDQGEFDFLVSDIGLPDGTGLDVIRHFRSRWGENFRAIALSGFGMETDVARSLNAGFDRHLVKPVDFQTVRAAIEELATRPPEHRQSA